jgi:hypothetical protein
MQYLSLKWLSVISAFLVFAALEAAAIYLTGGYFEYPLDDTYIHLAMAESIWSGGYGVNLEDYSAASSSALYPYLLVPAISLEFQRYMPLIWNMIGLGLSAWLWAELLLEGGYGKGKLRRYGVMLAAVGPAAVLMPSNAMIGMEHTLHAAASLAILLGLMRLLKGMPSWGLLFAGILFAPLFRFEGLALSLLAVLVIFSCKEKRRGAVALFLALVPILLFCGFLVSLGLDPLPSSVQAKIASAVRYEMPMFLRIIGTFLGNLTTSGGMLLMLYLMVLLGMGLFSQSLRRSPLAKLWGVLVGATGAHLLLGHIGWLNRYEHYILAVVTAGILVLLPVVMRGSDLQRIGMRAVIAVLIPLAVYAKSNVTILVESPKSIYLQQRQMSEFAKNYMKTPVAVNDLGWVAWGNPNYVLDLYGLGSTEALKFRTSISEPGWGGPMADRHGVQFAMVYEKWMEEAIGKNWIRVGTFITDEDWGYVSGTEVAFFATSPDYIPRLVEALHQWVPTLPAGTHFEYDEGFE